LFVAEPHLRQAFPCLAVVAEHFSAHSSSAFAPLALHCTPHTRKSNGNTPTVIRHSTTGYIRHLIVQRGELQGLPFRHFSARFSSAKKSENPGKVESKK
jgi:hypothetical protein